MEGGNRFGSAAGVLAAFCLGAVAGIATGVFIAPASGEENRKRMSQWLKQQRERGKEELLARKESIGAAIEAGRETYRGHKEKVGLGA